MFLPDLSFPLLESYFLTFLGGAIVFYYVKCTKNYLKNKILLLKFSEISILSNVICKLSMPIHMK